MTGLGADDAVANTAHPHLDPAALARGFRTFGDSVETAFRDPGAALAVARERAHRQRYQRSDLDGDEDGDGRVTSQQEVGVPLTLAPSRTAPLPASIRPQQIPASVRQPVAHIDVPTQGAAVVGADAELGEREVVGEADMCSVVGGPTCTDEGTCTVSTDFAGDVVSSVDGNSGLGIEAPMAPQQQRMTSFCSSCTVPVGASPSWSGLSSLPLGTLFPRISYERRGGILRRCSQAWQTSLH